MSASYICLRRGLGKDTVGAGDVRLVPRSNVGCENKRAVISNHKTMIMGDADGSWCDRRPPVEDVINRTNRSPIYPKESGFRREVKSGVGVAHVKGCCPVL